MTCSLRSFLASLLFLLSAAVSAATTGTAVSAATPTTTRTISRAALGSTEPAVLPPGVFAAKPYLQLGNAPTPGISESVRVMWQALETSSPVHWIVEVRPDGETEFKPAGPVNVRALPQTLLAGGGALQRLAATISDLPPGRPFSYRVKANGKVEFEASGRARKPAGAAHRVVIFGDSGAGSRGQRAIAGQTVSLDPDFVVILGDLVYPYGRNVDYLKNQFPQFNADATNPRIGAPLLRSYITMGAPGNHDTAFGGPNQYRDAYAYYYNWDQPLNGPELELDGPNIPSMKGSSEANGAIVAAASEAFPRMGSFSFDYGCAHWTILDSNGFVDWNTPAMLEWLRKDLESAKGATWRFVGFHHPPFHSSPQHASEQQTRKLSPIFEQGKVDVVFAGHVHNYQRSFPLRFAPGETTVTLGDDGSPRPSPLVDGEFTFDRKYDGANATKPDGIIYIVSGSGGAGLYDPKKEPDPSKWKPFTTRYDSSIHSLTVGDISTTSAVFRQIASDGREIDRFVISR